MARTVKDSKIKQLDFIKAPPEGEGAKHGGAFPAGKDHATKRGGD
jgi:hypothetical protein